MSSNRYQRKTTQFGRHIPAPFEPGAEKRRFPRRLVLKRVLIKVLKDETLFVEGFISDISVGGFGTSVNDQLSIDSKVKIEVTKDGKTIPLNGRVANCSHLPTTNKVIKDPEQANLSWRMGLEIFSETDEEKKTMADLFEHL